MAPKSLLASYLLDWWSVRLRWPHRNPSVMEDVVILGGMVAALMLGSKVPIGPVTQGTGAATTDSRDPVVVNGA